MDLIHSFGRFLRRRLAPGGRAAHDQWPFVAGKYHLLDASAPVVVALAGNEELAADLAGLAPTGLCMVAPLRSASDAEKLIQNIASNLSIQHVIVGGAEEKRQALGAALLALCADNGSALGETPAAIVRTIKAKVDEDLLSSVRKRIKPLDLLGCEDLDKILSRIAKLATEAKRPNTGFVAPGSDADQGVERVIAARGMSYEATRDKGGEFKIRVGGKAIIVEHHSAKNGLLRVIEGVTARDICLTLIRNGWVSKLDHAAYLGRELARAELALNQGLTFVQDDEQPIGAEPSSP